ncbi:MAG: AGE family epimerase/isomerase [Bacteroidota bacterium]
MSVPKTFEDLTWLPDWEEGMRSHFHQTILRYWADTMVDETHGGFYGRRDGRDRLLPTAGKGVILNARILWTFAQAARLFPDMNYQALAQRSFLYLSEHFHDAEHGGVYWMLDATGQPTERKKQLYAQAFAMYGYTEYFRLTQEPKALALAQELFRVMEAHGYDTQHNGYWEAFGPGWEPIEDVRLSEKDANATKTMNTHLHILEAYTNLYRVWPHPQVGHQLKNLILLFLQRFISPEGHFHLFFNDAWELQSHEISFGHDIEGSWLLYEAAEVLGEEELLVRVREVALQMVDRTLSEGMDADGGLMNEADPNGFTDTDKHWWPQAEALVGLVNAFQLSQNAWYLDMAQQTWQFIQKNLVDTEFGEWHWRVTRSGERVWTEDKAGPWKCPYHNGRALMECHLRLTQVIQSFTPQQS